MGVIAWSQVSIRPVSIERTPQAPFRKGLTGRGYRDGGLNHGSLAMTKTTGFSCSVSTWPSPMSECSHSLTLRPCFGCSDFPGSVIGGPRPFSGSSGVFGRGSGLRSGGGGGGTALLVRALIRARSRVPPPDRCEARSGGTLGGFSVMGLIAFSPKSRRKYSMTLLFPVRVSS